MKVEDHPTAQERVCGGYDVRIHGLPFPETVTPEHRYWAKTVVSKKPYNGRRYRVDGPEGWCEAKDLTASHYIGLPIDCAVRCPDPIDYYVPGANIVRGPDGRIVKSEGVFAKRVPAEFDDPEWWWLFGLWWGDGHVAGRCDVGLTIANTDTFIFERVCRLLDRYSIKYSRRERVGCFQVTFWHTALNRWLRTWRTGNSIKQPPLWVEALDLKLQAPLIQGYIDADGYRDPSDGSVRVTSVNLNGLLCLRRLLARFKIAATIRKGIKGGPVTIVGNACQSQDKYDLRFCIGGEPFGAKPPPGARYSFGSVFIEDGHIWSKVRSLSPSGEAVFIPVTTPTRDYRTAFGRSHNCFDDVDGRHDTEATIQKKIQTITTSLLPAGSADCAVLFLQNLIHKGSIVEQLVNGAAPFLHTREMSEPEPAVRGLVVDWQEQPDGTRRFRVTGGVPTWEGQNLSVCERQINDWGLSAFRREAQQEVDEEEGGLWSRPTIDATRVTSHPVLSRIAVGVDPNASEGGDAAGIIAAGVAKVGGVLHGYVLEDATVSGGPQAWATQSVALYNRLRADCLAAEKNNGGEMVAITIGTEPGAPPVKLLNASRGKITRAEPVEKLYEDGRIHHVGLFPDLEREICTYRQGEPSPNRMDALVWVMTELMLGPPSVGSYNPASLLAGIRRPR